MGDLGIILIVLVFWFAFFGPHAKKKEEKKDDKKGDKKGEKKH